MNAATDDPMFFAPGDFFDEVPFTPRSNDAFLSSLDHHSSKHQYPVSLVTEWPDQYPLGSLSTGGQYDHLQQPVHPCGSSIDLDSYLGFPLSGNTPSWMMNSLDSYLPDFNQENQNGDTSFPYHAYSQDMLSSPFSSVPSFYFARLPFNDSANCIDPFPNLPSFTSQEEMPSILGYVPPSRVDPVYPTDDFSDSDTTASTQSWMMPVHLDDELSTGGMVTSISTPLFRQPVKKRVQGKAHRSNSSHAIYSTRKSINEPRRRDSDSLLATTSTSESIASLLSCQRLSDREDDELEGHLGHHRLDQKKSNHKPKHYSSKRETYPQRNLSSSSDTSTFHSRAIKKGRNVDKACNHCKRSHLRCDNMRPCRRCIATGKAECHDVEHKPRGRPRLHNLSL